MAEFHGHQGPFDIPDVPNFIPRRLKPWIFIFFVIIIQFSGGVYLAAVSDMVGSYGIMQEDVLMAGYAMLIGMSVNFAVMFRLKFRFSGRMGLLICGTALIVANFICANTSSVPLLVAVCFFAGWFRMWATFICNSTIQLWLTPVRDMSIFFCYVYLLVDGVIQLSGICTVYTAFFSQWEYMHWIMSALLAMMMVLVMILVRSVKGPLQIPLLGIDWIGASLWSIAMICFTFVCVYGNFYDWWEASEIRGVTLIGIVCAIINLWRATFLHHPYISFTALTNRNVVRAVIINVLFFTILGTEHVFEHSYATAILGFDETNLIDLNWYVFAGILFGCGFTYLTFARRKWRYRTMMAIGFSFAMVYLAWFYFFIDYGIEKESLFLPLFSRGAASVIVSIVVLTSILQGGMHFFVFPQALVINGFTGAVMSATLGPAIIGEWLKHCMADNAGFLSGAFTDSTHNLYMSLQEINGMVHMQAMIVAMKEIYGWLLIISMLALIIIVIGFGPVKPGAIFPKWRTIRKLIRRSVSLTPFS